MITFEPLTMALGAEVSGIDLRQPLDAASAKALRAGLLDYQVLFFGNQAIDPSHHLALAHLFGEASPHPAYPTVPGYPSVNILESTAEKPTLFLPEDLMGLQPGEPSLAEPPNGEP